MNLGKAFCSFVASLVEDAPDLFSFFYPIIAYICLVICDFVKANLISFLASY